MDYIILSIVLYSRRRNFSLGSSCAQNDVILSQQLNMDQACDARKKRKNKTKQKNQNRSYSLGYLEEGRTSIDQIWELCY